MTKNKSPGNTLFFVLLTAFVAGLLFFGISGMTVATDKPHFCANCHVMAEQVWTHSLSIHAEQDCNQCHTPHNNVANRLIFKTKAGISDIAANFGTVPDLIRASKSSRDVIQDNCVRCHYQTVRQANMAVKPYCTDCHGAVPHMPKSPIDRRMAADG
jgi:cytochrome c nitrite reductase small subunit